MCKIGVAITCYNNRNKIQQCLLSLQKITEVDLHIEIVDDGSTDGTSQMITHEFPFAHITIGNGNLWWTGGTNLAIKRCLSANCNYILLLNADAVINTESLKQLLLTAKQTYPSIVASVAVSLDYPTTIWWAGSRWARLSKWIPIWTSKYIYKNRTNTKLLPQNYYETSEAHGRGVLIPSTVFEKIGLFDDKRFPHYGADMDFSLRAAQVGIKILIEPKSIVLLDAANTGMKCNSKKLEVKIKEYYGYLFKRKNGEAVRIWWLLTRYNLPFPDSFCTYIFILMLNSIRFWTKK